MQLEACRTKIHRATVTQADLNYKGSITIDQDLLDAAGMWTLQYVNITNLRNGIFWRTYIMPGERGSGIVCLNGPPAHHFQPGDLIIILAQCFLTEEEMAKHEITVVFVDEKNRVTGVEKHHAIKPETRS